MGAGSFAEIEIPYAQGFQEAAAYLPEILSLETHEIAIVRSRKSDEYLDVVRDYIRSRPFFTTPSGYIGLAP